MSLEKILITGLPHSGKSTLLGKVIDGIDGRKQGFVTREILDENGKRIGFEMVTASGKRMGLASISSDSGVRVSRYGVETENLDELIPDLLSFNSGDVLYIDEIGQMELYSPEFEKLVRAYLQSGNLFIATLSKVFSNDFIREISARSDVRLIEITPENRDEVLQGVRDLVGKSLRS